MEEKIQISKDVKEGKKENEDV